MFAALGPSRPALTLATAGMLGALLLTSCSSDEEPSAITPTPTPAVSAQDRKAITAYRAFVAEQVEASRADVDAFVAAVKAGDVARAKRYYAASRIGWESVEPVAEVFGDLDPSMDLRVQDVEPGTEWTGWHRLEKALWADGELTGMAPIADRLAADYALLTRRISDVDITVESIGNGAKELMDEVATGKVTGEEEAYSRTDLVDFAANVVGARQAFEVLRPLVKGGDPELVTQLDDVFADVDRELRRYGQDADFVAYDELTPAQVDALAAKVDALAEPLSTLTAAATAGR